MGRSRKSLFYLGGASLGAACATYVLALGTEPGLTFDRWSKVGLSYSGGRQLDHVNSGILGSIPLAMLVAVALVAWAAWHRRFHEAAGAVLLLLLANGVSAGLKLLLYGLDPLGGEASRASGTPSFPSGHATVAISAGLTLVLLVPRAYRRPAAVAGAGYAALVGIASVADGGHFPSDVAGSYLLTMALACTIGAAMRSLPVLPEREQPTRAQWVVSSALVAVLVIALAAGSTYWVWLAVGHGSLALYVRSSTTSVLAAIGLAALSSLLLWTYTALCEGAFLERGRRTHLTGTG